MPLAVSVAVRIEAVRIVAAGVHVRLAVEAKTACELRAGGAVTPPAAALTSATALVIVAVLAQVAFVGKAEDLDVPADPAAVELVSVAANKFEAAVSAAAASAVAAACGPP